jgi:two-component system CheB/CheR fusion protein
VLLAGVLIYYGVSTERDTVQKSMVDVARTLSAAVDSEIGRTQIALQLLAMSAALDGPNLDEFRRQAEATLSLHGRWSNLGLVRIDGTRLLNLRIPRGQPIPAGNDESFLEAAKRGQSLISDLKASPTSNRYLVYVSVPVMRNDKPRYVIAATTESELWTDWLRGQIPEGAIAAIDDRNGIIFARSERPETFVGRSGADVLRVAYAAGREGVAKLVNAEGDRIYAAFHTSSKTGWHTLILMRAAVVDARLERYGIGLASAALAVLVMAFFVSMVVARPLRAATSQLKDAITSIGRGDRPQPKALPIAELDDTHRAAEMAGELLRSAQRAVRNRTAQFEALLASAPIGAYLVDARGGLAAINPAAERLAEQPEGISGEDFREVIREVWGANAQRLLEQFDRTLATGEPGHIAELRDARTGHVHEWHMERLPLPAGGLGGVCYFRDVTAHVEARERLAQKREELQTIYETAPIGLCVLDRNLRFVRINRRMAEINGVPVQQHIGRTVREVLPGVAEATEPVLRRVLETGQPVVDFEFTGETPAHPGRRRTWVESWHPIKDAGGNVVAVNVVAREVTEQREAEAALRASEERFRIAQESSLVAFTLLRAVRGADGTIVDFEWVYANPAAASILKRPVNQLIGHRLLEVLPGNKAPGPLFEAYVRVVETGVGHNIEVPYEADGIYGAFQNVCSRLEDGVAVWFMDVSERRRATEELARQREELQTTVASLRKAQGQLQAADRQKDEFLAMLAHELRNPLTPIANACELLARTFPGHRDAQSMVGMIRRQVAQLTRLVDDLLDVSRITRGRIALKRDTIDLGEVVAQAVETVEPLVREKGHALSIVASDRRLFVNGDFARLAQCVVNVLNNAAKYTDPGGRLRIDTRDDGSEAVITITDNGPGIPPELLPHVFDLFVQGDRTLDRAQGGLGIGLSVVRELIEQHGGRVDARSDGPGRGATFEIRLPLAPEPTSAEPPRRVRAGSARRVLVVDDNIDAADSLALVLQLEGHAVDIAHTGADAIARVQAAAPDVVLLDIGLPQMDGYEVARRLRALANGAALRLVALTGYGQAEDVERARAAGFDRHIVKPVDLHAVLDAIAEASKPA